MNIVKKYGPGLIFVAIIALGAQWLAEVVQVFVKLETMTFAIFLGMLYNNTIKTQSVFKPGIKISLKKLLKIGIVLLGFKLNIQAILKLGPNILLLVVIYVPLILGLYTWVSKRFKVNKKLGTLLGVGSSICGASAVVALAPCIGADDDDAVIAVSIVSVIGAIGVVIYSVVANIPGITDAQYGIWSGLTLHGVAHALAAAFAKNDVSGEIGTFVKMTRVLMLVPVSLILSYAYNGKGATKKAQFPMYVLYFVFAGIINSLGILPETLTEILKETSGFLILMAMTAMGLSVDFKQVASKGIRGFMMGLILFAITATLAFFMIRVIV